MSRYDILRKTWIYQEIKQEIQQEERQHILAALRQTLDEIIQARFPRLLAQAQEASEKCSEPEQLHSLLILIATARLEKEARAGLQELDKAWYNTPHDNTDTPNKPDTEPAEDRPARLHPSTTSGVAEGARRGGFSRQTDL